MARAWSTCKRCSTCEYNDMLMKSELKCRKCNSPVKLHKARKFKDQQMDDQQPSLQGAMKGNLT
eukprot:8093443-Pyramimonas_sp.AAC.1